MGKALIFSGGGAKGAYEIGVWKALDEKRMTSSFNLVSGTSAGALNAVMFAQGNLKEAIKTWSTIQSDHILTLNNMCKETHIVMQKSEKEILYKFLQKEKPCKLCKLPLIPVISDFMIQRVLASYIANLEETMTFQFAKKLVPCFMNVLFEMKDTMDFESAISKTVYFMKQILKDGLFSQEGLEKLIDENLHEYELLHSSVKTYVTAYNISKLKIAHFYLNAFNQKDHKKILLASSAIPFIFDQVKIQNDLYIDGGIPVVGDNTPIDVAYEKGYRDMVVVVMSAEPLNLEKFPDANILVIQPKESLGSALASLNFNDKYTKELIQKGYEDALKKL